jgi:NADPH-dependent 2,4-dienoyl-CoA reductase/sulfur reductase-like enzyme
LLSGRKAYPYEASVFVLSTDGRILGAHALGELGVARRIDVIATAMMQDSTVFDLEDLELCYAPQPYFHNSRQKRS